MCKKRPAKKIQTEVTNDDKKNNGTINRSIEGRTQSRRTFRIAETGGNRSIEETGKDRDDGGIRARLDCRDIIIEDIGSTGEAICTDRCRRNGIYGRAIRNADSVEYAVAEGT